MEKSRPERRVYTYLTEEDREQIDKICTEIRKSHDSKQNMNYIVSNFVEFCGGNVFGADSDHAINYVDFLKDGVTHKRFQEQYCACVVLELRSFYARAAHMGLMSESPFAGMENPFKFPNKLHVSDLPTLSDVDLLLSLSKNNPVLHLAVLLAFRMALPVSVFVGLKKKDFLFNTEDGRNYLKSWRHVDGQKKEAFLLVPNDIMPYLHHVASSTSKDYEFLFRTQQGRPYAIRSMQQLLSRLQEDSGISIQFSQLRSLCIYLMLVKKVPTKSISLYTNVRGDWFSKYNSIPEHLIADAIEYVNLKVL